MAIPLLTKALEIIQKLSDLPNATDGMTANQLKAKFDEAGLLIQEYINKELIPNIKAENIPFTGTATINQDNIQDAIAWVYGQIQGAASGAIVDGSVTKEKLTAELLARTYGGRPWVSVNTPGAENNKKTDFPIGQIWLRPAFEVKNLMGVDWNVTGGTVAVEENRITLTGNNTVSTATLTQTITGMGQDGDKIYLLLDIAERDSELTDATLSINGEAAESIDGTVAKSATLMSGGVLSLSVHAVWPSTSLADGNLVLENCTVVNVSQIMRGLTDTEDMGSWLEYIQELRPLDTYASPAEIYIHMNDGAWWPMGFAVTPVTRGGTGLNEVKTGQMLYADGDNSMKPLNPPGNVSVMVYDGEKPDWQTGEKVSETFGFLRYATGTYTGNKAARTIELPVTPKLLHIHPETTTTSMFDGERLWDLSATLSDGSEAGHRRLAPTDEDGMNYYYPSRVKLSGKQLIFSSLNPSVGPPDYMNDSNVKYVWTAIY